MRNKFTLTAHASMVVAARSISHEWIARVIENPEKTEPHPDDPALVYAFGKIAEQDGRVLRVVYNQQSEPFKIVTVYFDRTMRNKL